VAVTTSTQELSHTHTVSSTDTSNGFITVRFQFSGGDTGTITVAQVQLELGSVATDFEHRSYGEELALCQRYYINRKINAVGAEYGSYDNLIWMYQYDMRASPSFSIPSGSISDDFVGGSFSYTPTGNYIDSEGLRISYYLGSTSIIGGRSYSADVVFDAEL